MMESGVMEEPRWPRCPGCAVELVERKDARTGRPVREGGRALLECPACGEMVIGAEPRRQMRRYRMIRTLVVLSGAAGGLAALVHRVLVDLGPDGLGSLGFFVMLVLIGGMAVGVQLGLDAASRALTLRNSPDARVTLWAHVVFWAAVVILHVWLMVRVGWPMVAERGSGGAGQKQTS